MSGFDPSFIYKGVGFWTWARDKNKGVGLVCVYFRFWFNNTIGSVWFVVDLSQGPIL